MTLQGWFRTPPETPLDAYARLLQWQGAFSLFVSDLGKFTFTTGDERFDTASVYDADDQWVYFALAFDGADMEEPVRFYIGTRHQQVRKVDVTGTGVPNSLGAPGRPLLLANQANGKRPFKGRIDNIRLFGDREGSAGALDSAQLVALRRADAKIPRISGSPRFFKANEKSPHIPEHKQALYQAHLYGEF